MTLTHPETAALSDLGAVGSPVAELSPYKGPESYQGQDAHLFFGRETAALQVIAKILSSRFTLLHAKSGAGKTSLLNARVVPGLEARGWLPVRATPQNDPAKEVKFETLRQLLPPPASEAAALRRALLALARPGEQPTVSELLDRYDQLSVRDERRRLLISPITAALHPTTLAPRGSADTRVDVLPFICRLLRSSLEVDRFDAHLAALCGDSFETVANIRADDLVVELEGAGPTRAYTQLSDELSAASENLRVFFENWWRVWGSRHARYPVVLILDQFEELFTRFADPGPEACRSTTRVLDWRVREEFLEELRELYEHGARQPGVQLEAPLTMRYVVSMRDEFVAQLDGVRAFVGELETASYHLALLSLDEGGEAIRRPAEEYGYTYSQECFDDIIRKLAQEGRHIEPAHVQIVCERLWQERGPVSVPEEDEAPSPHGEITYDSYYSLGFAEGILGNFIREFLEGHPDADRLEMLEMLEPLITVSGTRNIVEWSQLVDRSLRDPRRRRRLLSELENRTIVRVKWRLGGRFVEITHEFLIQPILRAIQEELFGCSLNARLTEARRALEQAIGASFRTDERVLLTTRHVDLLLAHQEQVHWGPLSLEVMLRSAAAAAASEDADAIQRARASAALYRAEGKRWASLPENRPPDSRPWAGGLAPASEFRLPPGPPDPAEVIAEYLHSPSAATRENAVRALAASGEPSAALMLARLTFSEEGDPRAEVAEQEVLGLDAPLREHAVAELTGALDQPKERRKAYAVLGRLYARGVPIVLPRQRLLDRLRRVVRPLVRTRNGRRPRRRWRGLEPGVLGGLVGLALLLGLHLLAFRDAGWTALDYAPSLLTFGILLGPIPLIISATRYSDPIQVHVDQQAASIVEVGRAALGTLYPLPIAVAMGVVFGEHLGSMLAIALVVALAAAAVRGGTLLAYEAFRDDVQGNRLAQWMVGSACGLVVLGSGVLLPQAAGADRDTVLSMMRAGVFLSPACFGLAIAYAGTEQAAPPRRPLFGSASSWLSATIVLATALLLAVAIVRAPKVGTRSFGQQRADPEQLDARSMESAIHHRANGRTWNIASLPTIVRFNLGNVSSRSARDSLITIAAIAPDTNFYAVDLVLRVFDDRGRIVDLSDDPPVFEVDLRPGTYFLEVAEWSPSLSQDNVLLELLGRIARSYGLRAPHQTVQGAFIVQFAVITPAIKAARDSASHANGLNLSADSMVRGLVQDSARSPDSLVGIAMTLIEHAFAVDSTFAVQPREMNNLCWAGALTGRAAKVLPFCERAVGRQPNDINMLDSRGLALALTGERERAIADLSLSAEKHEELGIRELRRQWASTLNGGGALRLDSVRLQLRAEAQALLPRDSLGERP